jgi:hypothetical protein
MRKTKGICDYCDVWDKIDEEANEICGPAPDFRTEDFREYRDR